MCSNKGKIGKKYQERRIAKEKIYREQNLKLLSIEADAFKGNKDDVCKKLSLVLEENGIHCASSSIPVVVQNHMELCSSPHCLRLCLTQKCWNINAS